MFQHAEEMWEQDLTDALTLRAKLVTDQNIWVKRPPFHSFLKFHSPVQMTWLCSPQGNEESSF